MISEISDGLLALADIAFLVSCAMGADVLRRVRNDDYEGLGISLMRLGNALIATGLGFAAHASAELVEAWPSVDAFADAPLGTLLTMVAGLALVAGTIRSGVLRYGRTDQLMRIKRDGYEAFHAGRNRGPRASHRFSIEARAWKAGWEQARVDLWEGV